jgi:hypothetical protein
MALEEGDRVDQRKVGNGLGEARENPVQLGEMQGGSQEASGASVVASFFGIRHRSPRE